MPVTSIAIALDSTGQKGSSPAVIRISSTDTYATIVSAGFLNGQNLKGYAINNGDIVIVNYNSGEFTTIFTASVIGSSITLIPYMQSENLPDGNIFIGNASNNAAAVTVSGDATIINTGALTIANNAVTTAKINNSAVTTDKITDLNVTTGKINDSAVTTAKIANANVTLAKLAPGITPTRIIVYDGSYAYGGGSSSFTIPVSGVVPTDHAYVQSASLTNNANLTFARAQTNGILVQLTSDPLSSQILYQVYRAPS